MIKNGPDNHVVVGAVRFTTRVRRGYSQRPGDVTQVTSDRVIGYTDHDGVLGPDTVVCGSHTLNHELLEEKSNVE